MEEGDRSGEYKVVELLIFIYLKIKVELVFYCRCITTDTTSALHWCVMQDRSLHFNAFSYGFERHLQFQQALYRQK
jgi:hypothetical protein